MIRIKDDYLFVNPDGTIDYIVVTSNNRCWSSKDIMKYIPSALAKDLSLPQLLPALRNTFLKQHQYDWDNDIEQWQAELNRRIDV